MSSTARADNKPSVKPFTFGTPPYPVPRVSPSGRARRPDRPHRKSTERKVNPQAPDPGHRYHPLPPQYSPRNRVGVLNRSLVSPTGAIVQRPSSHPARRLRSPTLRPLPRHAP
jgi:hypothetical protein